MFTLATPNGLAFGLTYQTWNEALDALLIAVETTGWMNRPIIVRI